MTRFAVDAPVLLRLAREEAVVGADHQLVGPGSLRSDVLPLLLRAVRAGDLSDGEALVLLDRVAGIRMRLLGDRVSRRVAWRIAVDLDLADTRLAEHVAVATLQADVLVTEDPVLVRAAQGRVRTAGWPELARASSLGAS
ncbi:MAG TPA: hypothetical protein VLO09_06955 [Ornithinimicrobium sp.]|nr:hypothetical protein [Ornithinimicrobium sp.]